MHHIRKKVILEVHILRVGYEISEQYVFQKCLTMNFVCLESIVEAKYYFKLIIAHDREFDDNLMEVASFNYKSIILIKNPYCNLPNRVAG